MAIVEGAFFKAGLSRGHHGVRGSLVAEAAEVEMVQGFRAAEALLKSAEVPSGHRQLQQASAEAQQQQSSATPELQRLQQLQQVPDPKIAEMRGLDPGSPVQSPRPEAEDGAAVPGVPPKWCDGVVRLSAMPPARSYPAGAWQQLIADAKRFLETWAQQAAALGWSDWELFGCHRRSPWGRIQGMGLVLLLRRDEIAALTATEAVIRTRTGVQQIYRRKPRDPLHPAERCLIWELA